MGPGGLVIIVIASAAALALFLLVAFGVFPGLVRTVTRSFFCPVRGRYVTAEFQEEAWDGERLEVNTCTAFTPPTAVTCEKICVNLKKLPRVATR